MGKGTVYSAVTVYKTVVSCEWGKYVTVYVTALMSQHLLWYILILYIKIKINVLTRYKHNKIILFT